jgi:hypothetical protein
MNNFNRSSTQMQVWRLYPCRSKIKKQESKKKSKGGVRSLKSIKTKLKQSEALKN